MRQHTDRLLHGLILIRVGQELGSDTELARAVASCIDSFVSAAARLFG